MKLIDRYGNQLGAGSIVVKLDSRDLSANILTDFSIIVGIDNPAKNRIAILKLIADKTRGSKAIRGRVFADAVIDSEKNPVLQLRNFVQAPSIADEVAKMIWANVLNKAANFRKV